jgi:hypothetical protein
MDQRIDSQKGLITIISAFVQYRFDVYGYQDNLSVFSDRGNRQLILFVVELFVNSLTCVDNRIVLRYKARKEV